MLLQTEELFDLHLWQTIALHPPYLAWKIQELRLFGWCTTFQINFANNKKLRDMRFGTPKPPKSLGIQIFFQVMVRITPLPSSDSQKKFLQILSNKLITDDGRSTVYITYTCSAANVDLVRVNLAITERDLSFQPTSFLWPSRPDNHTFLVVSDDVLEPRNKSQGQG